MQVLASAGAAGVDGGENGNFALLFQNRREGGKGVREWSLLFGS